MLLIMYNRTLDKPSAFSPPAPYRVAEIVRTCGGNSVQTTPQLNSTHRVAGALGGMACGWRWRADASTPPPPRCHDAAAGHAAAPIWSAGGFPPTSRCRRRRTGSGRSSPRCTSTWWRRWSCTGWRWTRAAGRGTTWRRCARSSGRSPSSTRSLRSVVAAYRLRSAHGAPHLNLKQRRGFLHRKKKSKIYFTI